MTLSYFDKSAEVELNSSGYGIAVLKPDTGQYWLPTFVHVGTSTFNGSCSVHIGGPGVVDYTTQIDETGSGGNDTTAACSGMIVPPGNVISAQFFGGSANDTALMRVVGVSSDIPPTIGIEPGIPGHKFSGTSSTVYIANQPISVNISNTPTVDIGAQPINTNDTVTSITDKRQYPNNYVFVNSTIAAGSSVVIVPATVGVTINLHTVSLSINATAQANQSVRLQTTVPNTIIPYVLTFVGTAGSGWDPVLPPIDMKGLPLSSGVGLEIANLGSASVNVSGVVTYST
jgi:hypothetical protein